MKNRLLLWQLFGFAFTVFLGTLLHFVYDWSGRNILAATISGVNESTWEHMKLLYFPMLAFAVIQSRYFGYYKNFWWIKLVSVTVGLVLIPVLFYTYNGVIGKSPDWVNIAIFFVSAAVAFLAEAYLFRHDKLCFSLQVLPLILICIIGVLFVVFTFAVPKLAVFRDPITQGYGIIK